MGISGAALATLISYFLLMIITVVVTRRWFRVDFNFVFFMKSILASLLMSLAVFFLKPGNIFYIILIIILGLVIYIVIMVITRALKLEDYKIFKNFFKFR